MKAFRSIRWRLQFWYGLILASVLAGFAIAAYAIERSDLLRTADSDLERRVGALARSLHPPPPLAGAPRRPPEGPPGDDANDRPPRDDFGPPRRIPAPDDSGEMGEPIRQGFPGPRLTPKDEADYAADSAGKWYYVIWLRNGPRVTRSPNAPADAVRPAPPSFRTQAPILRIRGDTHEAFLSMGPGDTVLVGRSLTADLTHLHNLAWLMAIAAGLILALGLLVGRCLVGLSLAPIAEISAAAAKIAAGDLGERIASEDTESELGELAQVLNTTFARLEASFARQARFTADAAHELRTPLAVLLTHTQNALAVACASEEHREALEACQRAAQRMRALTESLLWLARLDSGSRQSRKERFNLAERAAAGAEALRPLAAGRGIVVRTDLAPAECVGDPDQIDQIVTNLISNAIGHNFEKGEVRVATRTAPEGAVLTVADDGPGIAAAHLPRVFERFYRADESRSRSSGGVGLGLAIAKAIAEAHGGSIRAESGPGRGAVFTLVLPK